MLKADALAENPGQVVHKNGAVSVVVCFLHESETHTQLSPPETLVGLRFTRRA